MKWLKMRTCSSSGYSRWEYKPLYVEKIDKNTNDWVQQIIEAENDNHSWSEHFRGVEYFIINTKQVPNSVISETCVDIERSIEYAKESIVKSTDYLAKIRKLNGKGKKTDPDEIEAAKRKKKFGAYMERRKKEIELENMKREKEEA